MFWSRTLENVRSKKNMLCTVVLVSKVSAVKIFYLTFVSDNGGCINVIIFPLRASYHRKKSRNTNTNTMWYLSKMLWINLFVIYGLFYSIILCVRGKLNLSYLCYSDLVWGYECWIWIYFDFSKIFHVVKRILRACILNPHILCQSEQHRGKP